METYAQVLTYAIPGFVILIVIEYVVSLIKGVQVVTSMDTVSSLSSGMTNTLKDIIKLGLVIVSYGWMVDHLSLFTIESELWLYLISFILIDLASYWSHRFNHEINLMWNRHIIHHSSEEFNLSCALRQSISGLVGLYFFLYIPMAIIGIPTIIIAYVAPLHLFAQFWYHTRLIDKMGWLEYVIVTPSHHRVHHAINDEYLDKNFAAIFIFWDKLFGTFKREDPNIPPVYGIKKPARTWNPFIINFMHLGQLAKDAYHTAKWTDKLKIWFMPTGWRPKDVAKNDPISIIKEVYDYEKYAPEVPSNLIYWAWFQLIVSNVILFLILTNIGTMEVQSLLLMCAFLGLSIFGYTSLMDKHIISLPSEIAKAILGMYILTLVDFNSMTFVAFSSYILISLIGTLFFLQKVGLLTFKKRTEPDF